MAEYPYTKPTSDISWADTGSRAEIIEEVVDRGWDAGASPAVEEWNALRHETERHMAWVGASAVRTFDAITEGAPLIRDDRYIALKGDAPGLPFLSPVSKAAKHGAVSILGLASCGRRICYLQNSEIIAATCNPASALADVEWSFAPGSGHAHVRTDGVYVYTHSSTEVTVRDAATGAIVRTVSGLVIVNAIVAVAGEPGVDRFYFSPDSVTITRVEAGVITPAFITLPTSPGIWQVRGLAASKDIISVSGARTDRRPHLLTYDRGTGALLTTFLYGSPLTVSRENDFMPVYADRDRGMMAYGDGVSAGSTYLMSSDQSWDPAAGMVASGSWSAVGTFANDYGAAHDAKYIYIVQNTEVSAISKLSGGWAWRLTFSVPSPGTLRLAADGRGLWFNLDPVTGAPGLFWQQSGHHKGLWRLRAGVSAEDSPCVLSAVRQLTRG